MKNSTFNSTLLTICLSILFFSCEKVINPELQSADRVLVVDAWLTDKPETQIIKLTYTQPYFDSTLPTGVPDASVTVTDDLGKMYYFAADPSNIGNYIWTPASGRSFGQIGRTYNLKVVVGTETFTALSEMKRTTDIDSITFSQQQARAAFPDGSYVAEFWGRDMPGVGDAYWIRSYKNGVLLDKPSEISTAFDSGFSPGGDFDGVTFIAPIRRSINPLDKDPKDDTKMLMPFVNGDSIYVELHSITLEAFNHITQLKTQTNRNGGFGELFAKPLSNVSTNIYNINANGSKVVGFFSVSAVKGNGKKFTK
jgi:hypothetical protein